MTIIAIRTDSWRKIKWVTLEGAQPKTSQNGQFSKCHVCFCGLDPGNLKL